MSIHPVETNDNRQASTRITLLAVLIATLFALSIALPAQDDFDLPPSLRQQNTQNVARPSHSGDQVLQYNSPQVPLHVPLKLYQCEARQCGTWEFNGSTGAGQWPHGGAVATFTVEKFDFDGIIIHRRDVRGNTPGLTAIYTGKIVGHEIKGEVTWTWAGFGGRSPHTVWGATVIAPADYSILDPNLPCKSYAMSSQEALYRGSEAMDAKRYDTGLCWIRLAANQGNSEAEGVLAVIYYRGYHVPRNLPEAIKYAQSGAAAGNEHAEGVLWKMYEDGTLPKDQAKSSYWGTKFNQDRVAAEQAMQTKDDDDVAFQKEAMRIQNVNEQAQNKAIQAQQGGQNAAATIMLGLFLGALIADVGGTAGESQSGGFEQNQRDAWDRGCRSGNAGDCHNLDPLNPDYEH